MITYNHTRFVKVLKYVGIVPCNWFAYKNLLRVSYHFEAKKQYKWVSLVKVEISGIVPVTEFPQIYLHEIRIKQEKKSIEEEKFTIYSGSPVVLMK